MDLLCSLDGVLRVKHSTLVVTREGGTQQKAKATIIEGGWIWVGHNTIHSILSLQGTYHIPYDIIVKDY